LHPRPEARYDLGVANELLLPGAQRTLLARALVCARGTTTKFAAWRLEMASTGGSAAVVLVEPPGGGTFYRGEGACLGWTQGNLEQLYRSLLPVEPSDPEPLQLG
jgi:hypothetical protein